MRERYTRTKPEYRRISRPGREVERACVCVRMRACVIVCVLVCSGACLLVRDMQKDRRTTHTQTQTQTQTDRRYRQSADGSQRDWPPFALMEFPLCYNRQTETHRRRHRHRHRHRHKHRHRHADTIPEGCTSLLSPFSQKTRRAWA